MRIPAVLSGENNIYSAKVILIWQKNNYRFVLAVNEFVEIFFRHCLEK